MCEDLIKAKDQTITMLADQVDFLRHQLALAQQAAPASAPAVPPQLQQVLGSVESAPTGVEHWLRDPVEEIEHALETGAMSTQEAEEKLAALQAQQTVNG
jgi:hypothetical protein